MDGDRLERSRGRGLVRPPESFAWPATPTPRPPSSPGSAWDRPHVAGLSFGGALALTLDRRHPTIPRTLTLASATAGWAGSLPTLVVLPAVGHVCNLEAPDEFNRVVRSFLPGTVGA